MDGVLIVDAGSSKTDWSFLIGKESDPIRFKTDGINPAHMSCEAIRDKLKGLERHFPVADLKEIYYFGAGCASAFLQQKVKESLIEAFQIQKVSVASDLYAASLALFGDADGIPCILGTGSNSGLYLQGELKQPIPSLGYIIGDEGSGVALGKRLLNNIFKKLLSPGLIEKFESVYKLHVPELIESVYLKPRPAQFLSSFSTFLKDNIHEKEIVDLVSGEFDSFFIKNILPLGNIIYNYKVGFVGSIAFYFEELVKKSAEKFGLEISSVIKKPLPSLERYFLEK